MTARVATVAIFVVVTAGVVAQGPATSTMKQLMLDLIHPAANDILLTIARGAPTNDKEWAAVRRSAITLAEAGHLLATRGRAGDDVWLVDARLLSDAGTAAYRAAQAKDALALAPVAQPIDDSCTTCHTHYRPNVFPRDGAAK